MKNGQPMVLAIALALVAIGGCGREEKAQPFGARAELSKLQLGIGGGPPAAKTTPNEPAKETPTPEGAMVKDRTGRTTLGTATMTPMTPTTPNAIGPRAHGELTGAPPKNPITSRP